MKFRELYPDKLVSNKLNNGEFDYWLVITTTDLYDACGEEEAAQMGGRWLVSCTCVAPSCVSSEDIKRATESCGRIEIAKGNDLALVEVLDTYGIRALIWEGVGPNLEKLLCAARREARLKGEMLFGFAMDAPQNRIGTTGWEMLSGNITAGLNRSIQSESIEGQILGKMYNQEKGSNE